MYRLLYRKEEESLMKVFVAGDAGAGGRLSFDTR